MSITRRSFVEKIAMAVSLPSALFAEDAKGQTINALFVRSGKFTEFNGDNVFFGVMLITDDQLAKLEGRLVDAASRLGFKRKLSFSHTKYGDVFFKEALEASGAIEYKFIGLSLLLNKWTPDTTTFEQWRREAELVVMKDLIQRKFRLSSLIHDVSIDSKIYERLQSDIPNWGSTDLLQSASGASRSFQYANTLTKCLAQTFRPPSARAQAPVKKTMIADTTAFYNIEGEVTNFENDRLSLNKFEVF
ncbi:MAG: hypothetical protein ABJL98_11490 [Lentilitoribacter sp.]